MQDMTARGRLGNRLGFNNNQAEVEFDKVSEVRARFTGKRGELTALAKEYGVSRPTIRNWVTGAYRCQC